MARFYFGGSSPVGRRLDVGRGSSGGRIEIVGVANDVKYRDLKSAAPQVVYVPFDQMAPEERFVVAVRTTADAAGMMRVVEREVKSAVPAIPIVGIKTLERQKDETLVNERLLATLSGFFGLLALAITATGIYGLVSYSVTRRLFELGLRIALGARRRQVLWLVLRGTLLLVGLGVVIGLSAAVATSTLASTLLSGVQPHDRWVYWASGAALGVVSLAAAVVPAIHASRIEPIVALRCE
jgi:ABC-type antimicrobial peptide transport system permease subunit